MCVCTHTFLFPAVSFPLPTFLGWKYFIAVALPLFSFLGESAQSSPSVALLCLCSLLHMLCEYLQAVSYVFNLKRIFHQISPMCMKATPFSEVEIGFYSILLRFLLLSQCTVVCLRSWDTPNTLLSWLCKLMVRKGHNHLLITIWIFFLFFFCQADLNTNIEDESRSFYGVSSQYESPENMVITCSTKVCSFGKQVVEKVEVRSRHLGARLPLAAVLSLQVFASCLCISRQNISHDSCQGDGCYRYKITQPAKWSCHRISLKIC